MDESLLLLRRTHVVIGVAGLIAFWIPLFAPKGRPLHVVAGRVFVCCAVAAGGTGLVLSLWAIVHPPSFFGDPQAQQIAPDELASTIAGARFLYALTGTLAISVIASTVLGWRTARAHRTSNRLAGPGLLTVLGAYALWSAGLIAFGAWQLVAPRLSEASPGGADGRGVITIVIGALALWGAWSFIAFVRAENVEPSRWLGQHMECMLGAGVGFHAAALFFIVNGLADVELRGAARFAPLALPFVVGVPFIWWGVPRWERAMRRTLTES